MKASHIGSAILILIACALPVKAKAQQYYVVVGVFAIENNAIKYSGFVRSRFFQATYEIHPKRDLFYVYVIKTADKKEAIDQAILLQKEEAFTGTWVFKGTLGRNTPPVTVSEPVQEPVKEPEPVITTPEPEPAKDTSQVIVEEGKPTAPVITEQPPTETAKPKRVVKGKLFKFDIQLPTGEAVAGNVHHVDLRRGRDIASFSNSDYSDLMKPEEEPMTLVCGIFGYKEITHTVAYENPGETEGVTQDAEGAWVIPFKLERLKKGDVSVMYDVSFYKDAVSMVPRSQEELDELVNLMKSNEAYKIKVHGHTNGNSKRRIASLGKTKNYFAIEGSDYHNGSAKDLSKERAEAIRDYLVEHGIEESRIDVQGWGGLNMLVGEGSSSSRLNDRIEIEILND